MAFFSRQSALQRVLNAAASQRRLVSTLPSNSYIKVFDDPATPGRYILSLLSSDPPNAALALGTTNELPPSPRSFKENANFRKILDEVVAEHGSSDDFLKAQARAFVGPGGTSMAIAMQHSRHRRHAPTEDPAVASHRVGGHIHLSDTRNPPEFGRIAWPEDILGSVEVDGEGDIIGRVEPSGTYRIVTNQGILGLSPYMMGKLAERLRAEESRWRESSWLRAGSNLI
ncbi:hypothetical protein BROUX41_000263 [Berkeleyomyces rouxiae]|uniref:uncharacterized protein n=1 Tax=Berkeleyomyces rouxiae TaxID=2035830 RepID=UPI003B828B4F